MIFGGATQGRIQRDPSTWFDVTQSWTFAYWAKFVANATAGGLSWLFGPIDYSGPYIGTFTSPGTTTISAFMDDGSGQGYQQIDGPSLGINVAAYIAVRYTASTHTVELLVNSVVVASLTYNLTLMANVVLEQMLNDLGSDLISEAGYVRRWQAVLSDAALALEAASPTAVRTQNLLADTPLPGPVNLYDVSGNGHDWTSTGVLTYVVGPQFTGQYAGAVGVFGGFGRSDVNNAPGAIRIGAGLTAPAGGNSNTLLWVRSQFNSSGPPWPDNPLCFIQYIWVEWVENDNPRQVTDNLMGYPMQFGALVGGIGNCNINQSIEFRFRVGTYDSGTGLHAADGYWELRVNGVIQASRTSIALGLRNFGSWDLAVISPSGGLDNVGPPGHKVPVTNGGISSLYINNSDTYGVGSDTIVNNDFAVLTDDTCFWDKDPNNQWQRWANESPSYGPSKGSAPPFFLLNTVEADPGIVSLNSGASRCCTNSYWMTQYVTAALLIPNVPTETGAGLMTQLPLEVAYDYGLLKPKGGGLDWITPPPTI